MIDPTETELKKAKAVVAKYRKDPTLFFRKMWPGDIVWSKMEEICKSVIDNKRTYVRACHSSSKTHTAAKIAIWWICCWRPSLVITTAPTARQVEKLLWGEIRGKYNGAEVALGGKMMPSSPEWKISDDHYAIGFTTKPEATVEEAQKIQGFHTKSGRVLVIVDEASAVADTVHLSINSLLTSDNSRLLEIGNPLRIAGEFYNAFKTRTSGLIHISGQDCLTLGKGVPGLITQGFIDEEKARFDAGNNPMYEPRCLGEFPTVSVDNTIIKLKDLEAALTGDFVVEPPYKIDFFSIDWAIGGASETVIQHWHNGNQSDQLIFNCADPDDSIGRVVVWIRGKQTGRDIWADDCGIGKVLNPLLSKALGNEYKVHLLNSNGGGDETYYNLRAQMWFNAQTELHRGGNIKIMPDAQIKEQLLMPYYFRNRTGKILVASKEDLIKDFGRSPDRGDCTVYGIWGYTQMSKKLKPPPMKPAWVFAQDEPAGEAVLEIREH
ncbi:MAG: hypothetical protein V1709_08545 [Planctomycetota bacterium]